MECLAPELKEKSISFSSIDFAVVVQLFSFTPKSVRCRRTFHQIKYIRGFQQQHQQQKHPNINQQNKFIILKFDFHMQKMRAAFAMRMEHGTVMRIMINVAILKRILPMARIKHEMLK